ncbi:MAG TPA: arginine decarboxylase, pyruvoyl-dependent [Candidatus Polarisedimenticolia bacterium]|nr:arginine decarboxylase, pyruvoyl-dependent [Candidatus Polarisedimenticolia bacterium]
MKRTTDPSPPISADAQSTALVADRRSGGFSLVPTRVFFTKGVGSHRDELRSFELALKDAGIEKLNLVHVSSIFPPMCKIIPKDEGVKLIAPGSIAFCVMARLATNEMRRLIASSIGCAIPADKSTYGYLSEHHAYGQSDEVAGDFAEDMAASMLASTLGVEFDETANWDEKEQVFKISGEIIRTFNVTQSAVISAKGWTTVLASAVFLF